MENKPVYHNQLSDNVIIDVTSVTNAKLGLVKIRFRGKVLESTFGSFEKDEVLDFSVHRDRVYTAEHQLKPGKYHIVVSRTEVISPMNEVTERISCSYVFDEKSYEKSQTPEGEVALMEEQARRLRPLERFARLKMKK